MFHRFVAGVGLTAKLTANSFIGAPNDGHRRLRGVFREQFTDGFDDVANHGVDETSVDAAGDAASQPGPVGSAMYASLMRLARNRLTNEWRSS